MLYQQGVRRSKLLKELTLDARIAGASSNWNLQVFWDDWCGLWLRCGRLWRNCLGRAVDDLSVLNKTLNHPVILAAAKDAPIDTGLAEIIVAIIAGTAMIVLIWDRFTAVVAENGEYAGGQGWWNRWSDCACTCLLTFIGQSGQLCKPLIPSGSATSNRDLSARTVVHSRNFFVMEHAGNLSLELSAARSHRWDAGCASEARSRLVDEEFLKPTLDLGNRTRIDCLLRVTGGR
jgi:hypothetical protein